MVRTSAAVTLGAMISFALPGSTTHAEPDRTSPNITVQVQGQMNVEPATLFGARADVTRLYRDAGVELLWVPIHPAFVIILGGEREACAMGADPETVGQAVVDTTSKRGRIAYVYYDRVEHLAGLAGVDPAGVLGHVMAHEIAHLLGVSHAETGLMRAGWNDPELRMASRGLLYFSPAQRELMRKSAAAIATAEAHAVSTTPR